jgi:hypothetical protein
MSAQRKKIRSAVVSMLMDSTDAGSNVFGSRAVPLWDIALPCILVYAREEVIQGISSHPAPAVRRLLLAVDIRVEANDSLDDVLDDISGQVETLFKEDPNLNSTVQDCNLVRVEMDVNAQNEKPLGAARLTYEVIYT